MNLDIDRLHKEVKGRAEGQTMEMLVKALQNTEFSDTPILIVAHTKHFAADLVTMFMTISEALEFVAERVGQYETEVNGVRCFFLAESEVKRFCIGREVVVFRDHFAEEQANITKRWKQIEFARLPEEGAHLKIYTFWD